MKKLSQEKMVSTIINKRKASKLTQQDLSVITGINRSMLSRLEKMDYIPTIPQLQAIADVLKFDVVDLFEEEAKNKLAAADRKLHRSCRNRLCGSFHSHPPGSAQPCNLR